MRYRFLCFAVMTVANCVASASRGDDWPQWLGPRRDAIWREQGLVTSIPAGGLPVKWRVPVAEGYSGPAVVGGRVYVADYVARAGDVVNAPNDRTTRAGTERLLCLDAATGKLLWKHEQDCPYSISYASGPRCTPTVVDGRVAMLGAEGNLTCLDATSGTLLWSKDFKKDYAAPTPIWGFCGHPLVEGDLLICLVGGPGSVAVAFDRKSGVERWRALTASESGYCPPTMIESGGMRQLVIWDADNLNSLDPATGRVLWSQPLKPMYGMSIMAPQVADTPRGRVLFASGIGRVAALYALGGDAPTARLLWRGEPKSAVSCANATPFIAGTRVWIFSETGDLILARLSPEKYQELGRAHLVAPTNECFGRDVVWSHPAFAGGCIFVRNDRELVCVSATE